MSTALLILRILGVLWDVAPELVEVFKKIMAAIQPTPEAGNKTSAKMAMATAESILPVLPESEQNDIRAAMREFEQTPEYKAMMAGGG